MDLAKTVEAIRHTYDEAYTAGRASRDQEIAALRAEIDNQAKAYGIQCAELRAAKYETATLKNEIAALKDAQRWIPVSERSPKRSEWFDPEDRRVFMVFHPTMGFQKRGQYAGEWPSGCTYWMELLPPVSV